MSVDYFGTFFTDDGFDFSGLLNADFFQPVRILFQHQHYVSATKLLVVAIDSVSHIEYGDIPGGFVKWLNEYADLRPLGISAEELWEQRNSLLHMSSLSSRKVQSGAIRKLVAYVGEIPKEVRLDQTAIGYYNLRELILEFGQACGRWCKTYDEDRSKIRSFVERYDLIASDARMLNIKI
ncbi:hypothetical protein [Rubrivivax gelatinosus]|uniref:Uncharacterized protein n=1 Tax=Rubrivivax gelatinosus TaxID=28068 RepID=A0ABS1DZ64_RUBGE|nr:hypothetical protein [Rubrivivax gelatinosus]MBK1714848.1 hypothetical protein [Rubrivivax gelatinosus]